MEVMTTSVTNDLSEDGIGRIGVDYRVSLEGMAEGRNELNIEVAALNWVKIAEVEMNDKNRKIARIIVIVIAAAMVGTTVLWALQAMA